MNRRDFFKIVATTGATAAAAGCQQATEKLLPLVVPNDQIVPGVASWFSTVCRECPAGCGVIARNRDGRVVKLEGNPDHPVNQGTLCARGQAALQGVYHPDRFAGPQRRDGNALRPMGWDDALKQVAEKLTAARGAGKGRGVVLVSQLEHGSLGVLMDRFAEALGARPRVTLEPFGYEWMRAANRQVFNRDAIPYHAFEDAEVVLSFGADFLETWLSNVNHARGFGRMHAFAGRAGTFIHVEPRQSLTASNADEWVRNAPGTEGLLALAVLKVMVEEGKADKLFAAAVEGVDLAKAAADSGVPAETIKHIAHVFGGAKPGLAVGGGVAVAGSSAVPTLAAINLLNAAAGNVGKTVRFGPDSAYAKVTPYAEVAALAQAMAKGEIEVLLLGPGVNPAFTLPGGLKFADALGRVPFVVSFANQPDETTARAHLILPDVHWLERWGDYAPREGVLGLMQPTMSPIRDSRPMGDVLLSLARTVLGSEEGKGPLPWTTYEQSLRAAWDGPIKAGQWEAVLHQGGVFTDVAPAAVTAKAAAIDAAPPKLEGDGAGLVLLAYPSFRWYDGRAASRAWLQETPDTMTQAVWDAWVEISTETAAKLGIAQGDVVRLTSPHGTMEAPAYLSASLHPGAVAVPIGHRYAPYHTPKYVRDAGAPANPVALLSGAADPASGGPAFLGVRVSLARTGARRPLAILQATHDQDDRELVRHVDLKKAREQAASGQGDKPHEMISMYPPQHYPNHRWGMAVDVDRCIGCQACVVACIAENNIAVVGKAEAAYGRQTHWLRIERWAEGKPSHPEHAFLPMFCQHCEVAPCEPVCPVFAAYRTDEGLNGQVYNRCVGTRYCGNNCPYHVRRFNWYYYDWPEPLNVQLNPDVTVRQLGIMEKCTMCVQRIVAGKDRARDEKRPVKDGDILTACQQTCPTQAITFGNLKDEGSQVTKLHHSPRAYTVLDELGTRPSVAYLKKVTREHA
jgi:molybdopterin-containing oxidoreductase family iron-sulfur binding subunit